MSNAQNQLNGLNGKGVNIRHYAPGELMSQAISNFLSESRNRFPAEVGEVDLKAWPLKLAAYADSFFVCREDGSLSAALFAYLNYETRVGYIPFICALPECEKGTAHKLHEAYVAVAKTRGMKSLKLEVLQSNTHAFRFYTRHGYVIEENRLERNRFLMSAKMPQKEER